MAGTLPPLFEITETDHGGYVAVALYTLLILMVGLVITRVFTRWYIVRSIKADDWFMMAAAVLGIIQSVFVQLAIDNGLGKKRSTVNDSDFTRVEKYRYFSQIFLVAAIALSKISASLLVQSLLAEGSSLLSGQILLGVVIGWALSSIFALSFQCELPNPWISEPERCIDQRALHVAISSVNIITDVLLVVLPCVVVWRVHCFSQRRYSIFLLFATRLFVCIMIGVELKYFNHYISSSDKTWAAIESTVWEQVMMNLSIIFTAIPSLGRLLVELQPNVNAFAITENHGGVRSANDKYIFSSLAGRFAQDFVVSNRLGVQTSILGTSDDRRVSPGGARGNRRNNGNGEEGERVRSLRGDIIKRTIDLRMY